MSCNHPDRTVAPPTRPFEDISLTRARDIATPGGFLIKTVHAGHQQLVRLALRWAGGTTDFAPPAALSILTESMREGSASYTGEQIADIIDFNGARLTTRTHDHHCGFDLLVLKSHLADVLPVLRDMIMHPNFEIEAIERIKNRLAARCAVQMAKVETRASVRTRALMLGADHPGAVHDTPESIMDITADDLRALYAATIGSARLYTFACGDLSDDIIRELSAFVDSLAHPAATDPINIIEASPAAPARENDICPDARQSAVSISLPAIPRSHPDYIALRLTIMALGGYFGSRLMQNIREERGLTYGISSSLLGTYEGSYAMIEAQCSAESVETVISESMAEVERLVTNPPTGDELRRLKLKAWSALASAADSPISVLEHYITQLVVGTADDYFERQLRVIESITPEMISEMARKYLSGRQWSVVVSGPEA